MAKNISRKKPLVGNKRSHSNKATKMKQRPNLITKVVDGVKVKLSAREARTLNKQDK